MGKLNSAAHGAEEGGKKRFKKAVVIGMAKAKNNLARFKMLKKAGFDGVEASPLGNDAQRKALREAADETGIKVHSVMNGGWGTPFTATDEKGKAKARKAMENSILTAKVAGADTVLLVPVVCRGGITQKVAWERSQEQIPKLFPLCKETGVTIAIENVWNNFTYKLDDFIRYIDDFNSPHVKAYFDVGNHVIRSHEAKPQEWIRKLGKRTVKVHLKDYKLTGRGKGKWADLLEGSVEWPEVMKAFGEVGYEGWLTCEVAGGGAKRMQALSEKVDKIIAMA